MKDNIYELIYLFFLKDEQALSQLIEYYRPTTHFIIQNKGLTSKQSSYIFDDYFHLADIVLYDCLIRCQTHRYHSFSGLYKLALMNRIKDYNRSLYNHQIENHYPTVHLDQYIREDIEQYGYNLLKDEKVDIHRQILMKLDWDEKRKQIEAVLNPCELQILNKRMQGYSTAEISKELNISIRNVRYVLHKIKKWMMAH